MTCICVTQLQYVHKLYESFISLWFIYVNWVIGSLALVADLMSSHWLNQYYRKVSNISRTLVGNKIVDHSDVVGASPVGAAPTTSSFST